MQLSVWLQPLVTYDFFIVTAFSVHAEEKKFDGIVTVGEVALGSVKVDALCGLSTLDNLQRTLLWCAGLGPEYGLE